MARLMIVALVFTLASAQADTESVTVTSRYVTDYVVSLGGHTGKSAWQSSVTAAFTWKDGPGTFVGMWGSVGPGKFGDEIDLYAGLTDCVGHGRWSTTVFYYDLHSVEHLGHGDMVEAAADYAYRLTPRLKVATGLRWMQPVGGHAPRGAPVPYVEGQYVVPLAPRLSLKGVSRLSYNAGVFGGNVGLLSRSSAGLVYKIGPHGTIDVTLDLSWPLAGLRDRKTIPIISAGWGQTF